MQPPKKHGHLHSQCLVPEVFEFSLSGFGFGLRDILQVLPNPQALPGQTSSWDMVADGLETMPMLGPWSCSCRVAFGKCSPGSRLRFTVYMRYAGRRCMSGFTSLNSLPKTWKQLHLHCEFVSLRTSTNSKAASLGRRPELLVCSMDAR